MTNEERKKELAHIDLCLENIHNHMYGTDPDLTFNLAFIGSSQEWKDKVFRDRESFRNRKKELEVMPQ